jgi:cation diffusion facilitator CzcD-associated flavoprotein CzcO
VTYQYPWELKVWSKFYAYAPEILEYFKHVADKYGLRKFIKLQHEVIHAQWNDESGKWHVKVRNLADGVEFEDTSDVLVNASGIFK